MTEVFDCPTCHHTSNAYWHRLSPGVVTALVKFKHAVIAKGENSVHLLKDMDGTDNELTRHEWNNFTKLRFHGLAVRDKQAGAGYWLLTSRGNKFLRGELSVSLKVKTLNNHVIDHDELMVSVSDVMGSTPYFDDIKSVERERLPLEVDQASFAFDLAPVPDTRWRDW